ASAPHSCAWRVSATASCVVIAPVWMMTGTRPSAARTTASASARCSSVLNRGPSPVVPPGNSPCTPRAIRKSTSRATAAVSSAPRSSNGVSSGTMTPLIRKLTAHFPFQQPRFVQPRIVDVLPPRGVDEVDRLAGLEQRRIRIFRQAIFNRALPAPLLVLIRQRDTQRRPQPVAVVERQHQPPARQPDQVDP